MQFIKCGKFFDGINEILKENINILVEDDYILDVGEGVECPENAETIDLSDYTVTPGLIDAHVHFDFIGPTALNTYVFTDSDEMKALNTVYCAQKSLQGGFTTVRTIGSAFNGYGQIDAKRAIDKKMFQASRLVVSPHALDISGGHWDFSTFATSNPFLSEHIENACVATGNGVDFCRTAVRKYVKYGADFVKIMATGGFASPIDNPDEQAFSNDEIKAIIDTAKMFNKPVVAHAYTSELVSNLLDLGISEIEHAALMDEKTAEKLIKSGVPLMATFTPFEVFI
ncbi:amidohydrolase family protein, partial [uncultured Clostridium sp.]|uniref:amidohydrolase family protein n=1 Tax=uncultured Clostridium sp. TaxID=59620 RepID=UPI0025ED2910